MHFFTPIAIWRLFAKRRGKFSRVIFVVPNFLRQYILLHNFAVSMVSQDKNMKYSLLHNFAVSMVSLDKNMKQSAFFRK